MQLTACRFFGCTRPQSVLVPAISTKREWILIGAHVNVVWKAHFASPLAPAAPDPSERPLAAFQLESFLCKEFLILPAPIFRSHTLCLFARRLHTSPRARRSRNHRLSSFFWPSQKKLSCSLLLHPESHLPTLCRCLRYVHSKLPSSSLLRLFYAHDDISSITSLPV